MGDVKRDQIEAAVIALLQQASGKDVSLQSRIEQDLKVRGDDLHPIFLNLHDSYDVDFSTLDWDLYFHGE